MTDTNLLIDTCDLITQIESRLHLVFDQIESSSLLDTHIQCGLLQVLLDVSADLKAATENIEKARQPAIGC